MRGHIDAAEYKHVTLDFVSLNRNPTGNWYHDKPVKSDP
jgi:hypothetical protein